MRYEVTESHTGRRLVFEFAADPRAGCGYRVRLPDHPRALETGCALGGDVLAEGFGMHETLEALTHGASLAESPVPPAGEPSGVPAVGRWLTPDGEHDTGAGPVG